MTTRVDIEEIEATKSEKFLAVVLLAFLLIGTIWFYVKVDTWVPGGPNYAASAAEQKAHQAQDDAWGRQTDAEQVVEREKSELALAKNDFDIAVAKGDDAATAETDYKEAEAELREAQRSLGEAQQQTRSAERAVAKFERARQERMKRDAEAHRKMIESELAGMKINGIMGADASGNAGVARLNGELYRVGDEVAELFIVKAIRPRSVELDADGQVFTVSLDVVNEPKGSKKKK